MEDNDNDNGWPQTSEIIVNFHHKNSHLHNAQNLETNGEIHSKSKIKTYTVLNKLDWDSLEFSESPKQINCRF